MVKYKRKPAEVDAKQWNKDSDISKVTLSGVGNASYSFKNCQVCGQPSEEHGYIQETAHGGQLVCPGSWIVTEYGKCKVYNDTEFKEKFEVV